MSKNVLSTKDYTLNPSFKSTQYSLKPKLQTYKAPKFFLYITLPQESNYNQKSISH
jgi:hypothetical protein